jgi:hypothetical protein
MDLQWDDTDRRILKNFEINLFQCHHTSHTD